jgi:hypothetical protein
LNCSSCSVQLQGKIANDQDEKSIKRHPSNRPLR